MGCGGCLMAIAVLAAWVIGGPFLGVPAILVWLVVALSSSGRRRERVVVEHRIVRHEEPERVYRPPPELCHHCGAEIAATAAFCPRCGKRTFL